MNTVAERLTWAVGCAVMTRASRVVLCDALSCLFILVVMVLTRPVLSGECPSYCVDLCVCASSRDWFYGLASVLGVNIVCG